ncbi:hypothetical protein J1N35_044591 [Gossypium stocksii]|uniref:Uncharacterized protein n=1 Tax=Gossypium stocksii TaxID=47602 RepID=A0A9D3U9H5_9ROSI|nr:hypothetical protein J1N35_044591 [Gossypium stocksii]
MVYENEISETLMLVKVFQVSYMTDKDSEARKVLEEVFDARMREISETLQARCMGCVKKRDRSSLRLEPRSAKHVRTYLSYSKSSAGCGFQANLRATRPSHTVV